VDHAVAVGGENATLVRRQQRERDIGVPYGRAAERVLSRTSISALNWMPKRLQNQPTKNARFSEKGDNEKCVRKTLKNRHDFRRPVAPNHMFCYCLAQAGFRPGSSHFPTTV